MTCSYSSLSIYYITGTGNAAAAAGWFADEALRAGIPVTVDDISADTVRPMPHASQNPLIGFAYPTHGFNAIPAMIYFLLKLPWGEGRKVFLMNTRGGLKLSKLFVKGISGMALMLPAFILLMKGYRCIGFRPVDLPSNWIILHPGVRKAVANSIYDHWEVNIRRFAQKILSGKKVWRGLYSWPVDIALFPIALGYYMAGRFFLAKTFIAGTGCNLCGLCIKECPTKSIKLVDGRPYWKLTCESCMKCINRCPERAIQTTHGLAVAFWLILSSLFGIIFPALVAAGGIEENALWWKVVEQLLRFGVVIATVWAIYLIIHYLQRIKPFRYLFEFTSLSRLGFWRRYISPLYNKAKAYWIK
ncbi:MAG TPA: EFR1 family ferrodoxin [Bacteroidales bacterium]|nr:EFR1 family ferrodoxin [Bacteroidales bacterium]